MLHFLDIGFAEVSNS